MLCPNCKRAHAQGFKESRLKREQLLLGISKGEKALNFQTWNALKSSMSNVVALSKIKSWYTYDAFDLGHFDDELYFVLVVLKVHGIIDKTSEITYAFGLQQNVEYRVNLKTRQCNKTTPYRDWRYRGIPSNAQFQAETVIGAAGIPNEHVTINIFTWNSTDGGNVWKGSNTVCVLILAQPNFSGKG